MRLAPLAFALTLACAPMLVAAQEAYTHQYIVEGRLIGANGAPIPGVRAQVSVHGDDLVELCPGVTITAVTDEWGDFFICYQKRAINDGIVSVVLGELNRTAPVDQNFRRTVIFVQDMSVNGTAPPDWNTTFRIAGRVLTPGSVEVGGMQAYGEPASNDTMNVTVRTGSNATSLLALHTDGNGDFDGTIQLLNASDETHASATLAIRGQHLNRYLDPQFHRINVRMGLTSGSARSDVQSTFAGTDAEPPVEPPGSRAPTLSPSLLLVATASLGLMIWALRRAKN